MKERAIAEFIVIGGGVYGCGVALSLARQGADVRLLEANRIACGASGGPGRRGVRANGRDGRELPLMRLAYDLWPTLHRELGSEPFYERSGQLLLIERASDYAAAPARVWLQQRHGIETRLVETDELRAMEPELSTDVRAAIYCPNDGVADHTAVTQATANAARAAGAQLDEQVRVTGLVMANGVVSAVETDTGEHIEVSRGVLLLANPGVAGLLRQLGGHQLPVYNINLQVLLSEPIERIPFRHLLGHMSRTVSIKTQGIGQVMISGGWTGHWDEVTGIGTTLAEAVAGNLAEAVAVVPGLRDLVVAQADAGHLEAMSVDDIPIIDKVPGARNALFATGFSGHGWAIAPVITPLLADWALSGKKPGLLQPFALDRFAGVHPR